MKKIAVAKMIDATTKKPLRCHNGATVTTVDPNNVCWSETLTALIVEDAGARLWVDLLTLMKFSVDMEAWRAPGSSKSCFTFKRWEADVTALLLKVALYHDRPVSVLNTDLIKSFHHAQACAKGKKLPHEDDQIALAAGFFSAEFPTNVVVLSKSAGEKATKNLPLFKDATAEVTCALFYSVLHLRLHSALRAFFY